jgi:hypothetical protein
MAKFKILRPFPGHAAWIPGEIVEILDVYRAQQLVSQRYLSPVSDEAEEGPKRRGRPPNASKQGHEMPQEYATQEE